MKSSSYEVCSTEETSATQLRAAVCPCCSNKLIHHISNHRDYWFCRSCWQEMPPIGMEITYDIERIQPQSKITNNRLSNLVKPQTVRLGTI